jgi:hypothetical protein
LFAPRLGCSHQDSISIAKFATSQASICCKASGEKTPLSSSQSFELMSPQARAHLLLPDGTVTGRYPTVLLHEASTKPLLEYIRQKNTRNESSLHSINWEAQTTAINQTSLPHTYIIKLLHRILPTLTTHLCDT